MAKIVAENQGNRFIKEARTIDTSDGVDSLIVERPSAVMIIPFQETDTDVVTYVVKHHCFPLDQDIWQFPIGTLEDGRSPDDQARAELLHDMGLHAGKLTQISEFFVDPGLSRQRCIVFIAEDLTHAESHACDTPEHGLEIRAIPVNEVAALLTESAVIDSWGLSGVFLLERYLHNHPGAALTRDQALVKLLKEAEELKIAVNPAAYRRTHHLEIYDVMDWVYAVWQKWHARVAELLTPKERETLKSLESDVPFTPRAVWVTFFDGYFPDGTEAGDNEWSADIAIDEGFYAVLEPLLDLECRFVERLLKVNADTMLIDSDAIRIAELFTGRQRTIIDHIFLAHGAEQAWWQRPNLRHDSISATHVLGWIEGMMNHAPDQFRSVLEAILRTEQRIPTRYLT